jgi:adenosine deaminase
VRSSELDSAELPFPPQNFSQLFAVADKKGLRKCAHAEEQGPPTYVRPCIDSLKVHRVDYGIRSIEDPNSVEIWPKEGSH